MTVRIFTKNDCMPCKMTKRMFDKAGVEYQEINMEYNPSEREKVVKAGFVSAPVIEVDGEFVASGFKPEIVQNIITEIEHTFEKTA